ncbi:MAG: sugar phosphate isomerase/epimerase family protein [Microbacterium sp.]|uniref:sugar phosphate isomerase/epimerase family protein n=1 Tax=Microbacterium sp. TaxID=51671 RepID=UPI003F80CD38
MSSIKRGVSLYSYQQAYYLGERNLEQCIAEAAVVGAYGIETIADQMMPGYPRLGDDFYYQWHQWMDRYGTVPTAHDMFLEVRRHKGRLLTRDEMIEFVQRDIDHAARLGATLVRTTSATPAEIVEACLPHAEAKGVRLSLEIHSPRDFDHEQTQRHFDVYERYGPEWLGFVLDLGIYVRRFPRVVADRFIRDGATPEIVEHIVAAYDRSVAENGAPPNSETLSSDVRRLGGTDKDLEVVDFAAVMLLWSDPRRILDFGPYIHHVHAKFYEIDDDGTDHSIPYEEIVPILQASGFDGYLSSEYEGQRHIQDAFEVDEVGQVARQHALLSRLLGEGDDAEGKA